MLLDQTREDGSGMHEAYCPILALRSLNTHREGCSSSLATKPWASSWEVLGGLAGAGIHVLWS